MLFNAVSRCWGGMGINTKFQKARINCCIVDWTVPYEDDILMVIASFQDKNPQIPAKTAIKTFLSHLQTDQERAHPAFLLKHLYVLDHCVEEMAVLDTVGYYYNSNLTYSKSSKSIDGPDSHSPLRNLVNCYYAYLKTKARKYSYYENTYFSKHLNNTKLPGRIMPTFKQVTIIQDELNLSQVQIGNDTDITHNSSKNKKKRQCTEQQSSIYKLFQKQNSYNSTFVIIQNCQQIQRCILQMNKSYMLANRRVDLIKHIFIMCLYTFIRCYVIVGIGMKFLFRDFMSMSLEQLERFIKAFQYFNKQYTGDFIMFVQSNKNEIQIFKEINYNELTFINKDGMRILLAYQEQMRERQWAKKRSSLHKINAHKEMSTLVKDEFGPIKIIQLPHDVQIKIKQNMKIFYKPRKNIDQCLRAQSERMIERSVAYTDSFQQLQLAASFFQYDNFYHQDFSLSVEEIVPGLLVARSNGPTHQNQFGLMHEHQFGPMHEHQLTDRPVKSKLSGGKQHRKSLNKQYSQAKQVSSELRRQVALDAGKHRRHHGKSVDLTHKPDVQLTTQQILNSHKDVLSTLPINSKQLSQIKGMFALKSKQPKTNQLWMEWENGYTENGLILKN